MECSTKLQTALSSFEGDLGIYHSLINDIAMANIALLMKNKQDFEKLAERVNNLADEISSLLDFEGADVSGKISISEHESNIESHDAVLSSGKIQYKSVNDIPEKYFSLARKYIEDSGRFNDLIRSDKTTKEIRQMRKMIDNHSLLEGKLLYRRASVADFSSLGISNVTPQNLVGRKVVFSGFLSTTPNIKLANSVSHSSVLIEFMVPKGVHALDLSSTIYQEVIFNDKCEYVIERAWNENNGTLRVRARMIS